LRIGSLCTEISKENRRNIEELTIKEAREIARLLGGSQSNSHSLEVGTRVLIRTVTLYYTGRIVAVTDSDIKLEDAAWIADCGRFTDALISGELSEVEPYPDGCVVSRGAVIDVSPWSHELPRSQK
jgi:hypothetical protein